MLTAVSNALTQMIEWIGTVIGSLTTEGGALASLLPLFAIGIAVSLVMVIFKLIRKITWGA